MTNSIDCPVCGHVVAIRDNHTIATHKNEDNDDCPGSRTLVSSETVVGSNQSALDRAKTLYLNTVLAPFRESVARAEQALAISVSDKRAHAIQRWSEDVQIRRAMLARKEAEFSAHFDQVVAGQ